MRTPTPHPRRAQSPLPANLAAHSTPESKLHERFLGYPQHPVRDMANFIYALVEAGGTPTKLNLLSSDDTRAIVTINDAAYTIPILFAKEFITNNEFCIGQALDITNSTKANGEESITTAKFSLSIESVRRIMNLSLENMSGPINLTLILQKDTKSSNCQLRIANTNFVVTLTRGGSYIGQVNESDQPHGNGRRIQHEVEYDGQWLNGERHGHGKLRNNSANMWYEGGFNHNKYHGEGTLVNPDGSKHKGIWANDLRHGYGIETSQYGQRLEGDWQHGLKHGKFIEYSADGRPLNETYFYRNTPCTAEDFVEKDSWGV